MNNRNKILGASAAAAVVAGIAVAYTKKKKQKEYPPLDVVEDLDLDQYLGEWYEIARLPAYFETGCYGTKAEYSKNEDGTIEVLNMCHKGDINGTLKTAKGKAYIPDGSSKAKLKVQFFWPFKGDYWILHVGRNYEFALVGEPTRKHLWILSRTPQIELEALQLLVNMAKEKGFDTDKLVYTEQLEV